jgi:UDP-N-acetylglucosamine transferase subunit ALG13
MQRNVEQATAVVTQAAAASVMLCKGLGKKPIVVPRLHRLKEMVDDHQIPFGRRMAAEGIIELAETRDRFQELLDRALSDPGSFRLEHGDDQLGQTVQRIEGLLERLLVRDG